LLIRQFIADNALAQLAFMWLSFHLRGLSDLYGIYPIRNLIAQFWDLVLRTTAIERQDCEFPPGAHWQIQGGFLRMLGNTVGAGIMALYRDRPCSTNG